MPEPVVIYVHKGRVAVKCADPDAIAVRFVDVPCVDDLDFVMEDDRVRAELAVEYYTEYQASRGVFKDSWKLKAEHEIQEADAKSILEDWTLETSVMGLYRYLAGREGWRLQFADDLKHTFWDFLAYLIGNQSRLPLPLHRGFVTWQIEFDPLSRTNPYALEDE